MSEYITYVPPTEAAAGKEVHKSKDGEGFMNLPYDIQRLVIATAQWRMDNPIRATHRVNLNNL